MAKQNGALDRQLTGWYDIKWYLSTDMVALKHWCMTTVFQHQSSTNERLIILKYQPHLKQIFPDSLSFHPIPPLVDVAVIDSTPRRLRTPRGQWHCTLFPSKTEINNDWSSQTCMRNELSRAGSEAGRVVHFRSPLMATLQASVEKHYRWLWTY